MTNTGKSGDQIIKKDFGSWWVGQWVIVPYRAVELVDMVVGSKDISKRDPTVMQADGRRKRDGLGMQAA